MEQLELFPRPARRRIPPRGPTKLYQLEMMQEATEDAREEAREAKNA